MQNCRDEQSERFDLSKSSVTILPTTIKDVSRIFFCEKNFKKEKRLSSISLVNTCPRIIFV